MNRQYNNYLNRLQELINSKADTYEESILYQIEIVDYNLFQEKLKLVMMKFLKNFIILKINIQKKIFQIFLMI